MTRKKCSFKINNLSGMLSKRMKHSKENKIYTHHSYNLFNQEAWLHPDMTEKLSTGMLSLNTHKQTNLSNGELQ